MSHSSQNSYSIVVPIYNSEATLPELVARLAQVLGALGEPYEVILINDGSRDGSWQVICRLVQDYSWIHGINLMRNYGQHNALLCGIRMAQYRVVITMDDDLQHPPEEIPFLLEKLSEGYDVVYGIPRAFPHSFWRNVLSKYTKLVMAKAMGIKNVQNISAFRALRTDLRQAFVNYQSSDLMLDALLAWGTTRFAAVPVTHEPRRAGTSNYTFLKLLNQTMLMLTGFTTAPLRLASLIGLSFTGFGMLIFMYVVIQYFLIGSLPGFPFLASIIALFSGAQMFAFGVFGEYLARMFNRSMDRPAYTIRDSVRPAAPAK